METKGEYKNGTLRLMIKDDSIHTQEIKEAYYRQEGDYLVKKFEGQFPNADKLIHNFNRLIPQMFEKGDWEQALLFIAKTCKENNIVWFLTGSACDAVRGIDIVPHDLDIEIHSKDWKRAGEVFEEYMVEPFIEIKGWARDNFGRLVIANTQVDLVADSRYDLPNYDYEPFVWNGYTLWLEPFMLRYRMEQQRNRIDRIKAFEKYFMEKGIITELS